MSVWDLILGNLSRLWGTETGGQKACDSKPVTRQDTWRSVPGETLGGGVEHRREGLVGHPGVFVRCHPRCSWGAQSRGRLACPPKKLSGQ